MKYVELRRVNTDESFVDLPDYVSVTFDSVWNPSPSVISLSYPMVKAQAAGLQAGAFIAVLPDGTEIPDRYVLEQRQKVTVTDDGLVVTWSGRSMKALLEDDFVWPSAWPNPVPQGHAFIDANPGTIMKTFLTRSQARGFMTPLTHASFSGTVDSASSAWGVLIDKNFSNGTSLLSVTQNLFEMGLIEARTNKFAVEVYKPGNLSRHISIDTVCFTAGKNIADESTQEDASGFFTDVLMDGEQAAKTATDATAYARVGRRRARYSQAGGIADPGILQLLANTDLAAVSHIQTERSLAVTHQTGEPQPFVDYRTGDWVWLDVDGVPVEIQVQQVAVNVQRGQIPQVSITLGDLLDSIEESLKRRIDNITGSNAGSYGPIPGTTGTVDLAPAAPAGLGASFGTYVDDKGVNRVAATLTWTEVTTNADGTPAYDISSYEIFMRDDSATAKWQLIGKAEAGTPVAFYSPLPEATFKRFQVQAIDQSGKRSAVSTELRVQTPKDVTGPAQPSTPVMGTQGGNVTLSWNGLTAAGGSMDPDFAYTEVHKSKTSNFAPGPTTLHSRLTGPGFVDIGGLLPGESWFFKLRPVDISGNVGTPSAQASTTVAAIVDADLSQAVKDEIDLAQSTATGAQTSATTANTKADNLLNNLNTNYYTATQTDTAISNAAASGNKVIYSLNNASGTTRPDGKPLADGDIWRKVDTEAANGKIIAEWTWKTNAWQSRQYSGLILTALDAGSISTGFLDAARIQAGSLSVGQTAGLQTSLTNTQIAADALESSNLNPSFSQWASGLIPDNWIIWSSGPTAREATTVRTPPYAVRFNCTDTTTQRGLTQTGSQILLGLGVEYVTVTFEVLLVSGAGFGGAGMMVDWNGTDPAFAVYRQTLDLAKEIPNPVAGKWYRVSKVLRKNPAALNPHTSWTLFLMGQYSGIGSPTVVKDIIYNRASLRQATNEEILAYNAATSTQITNLSNRGADLVTNGTGLAGNNTNFSTYFNFDGTDAPAGASGSFVTKTTSGTSHFPDEFIAFDPSKKYRFSFQARQTVAGQGTVGRMYGMIAPYDAFNNTIQPYHYMYIANTTTTLAAPLNPGDTTITLTSSANWFGQTGKPAGAATYCRGIILWDYVDPNGKAWGTGTYSRNAYFNNLWADGGITGNVITLTAPWPASQGSHPAGTAVSNTTSGGSYMYMPSVQNVLVPETWTAYGDDYTAGVLNPASQAIAATGAATWATGVPPGTAKVKVGWLLNYPAGTNIGKHAVAAVSFSESAAAYSLAQQTDALTKGWVNPYPGMVYMNGGSILADSIGTTALKASIIGTKQLIVADTANMAEVQETTAGAVTYSGATHIIENVSGVRWSKRDVTTSTYFMFRNQNGPLPFKAGDRIRMTFDAFADATTPVSPLLWMYGTSSISVGFTVAPTPFGGAAWPTQITTSVQSFAYEVVVPATLTDQTTFLVGLNGVTNRDVRVKNVRVYRMNAGELVVDGSIEGKALKANSVTAAQIDATTLTLGMSQITNLTTSLAVKTTTFAQSTVPTSASIGDLWINTGDLNKMYRAAAVGANTIAAGQWVLYSDLTPKTTTFAQSGIPTATSVGDLWINTGDLNKMYRAAAVGASTIGAGAWVLVNTLYSTQTFAQSGIPTSVTAGDIWIDTANANKMYRAAVAGATTVGAGAWVLINDLTTKTTTFAQSGIPTSLAAGDLWVDTANSNKLYRAVGAGASTIAAGAWVLIQDPTAKSTTYAQGTIPTATAPGDIWVNTSDSNKMYRAFSTGANAIGTGVGKWEIVNDTSNLATSSALATGLASKSTTFAQSGIPTSTAVGDFWINTSDNNKMYRAAAAGASTIAAGAWVIVQDPTTKSTTFAQSGIPTSLSSGDIWVNIADSNKMYRSYAAGVNTIGAAGWVLIQDPTAKTTTFAQGTVPVSTATGDIWVDTANQNKMYRAAMVGADAIVAGEWVLVQDTSNFATTTALNTGLSSKTTTFAQGTIPTSVAIGDIWVNTSDSNKMYRAAAVGASTIAAGAWVIVNDITTKTTTFAQGTIPTSTTAGDFWVNTSDANKIYRAFAAGVNAIGASGWVLVNDLTTKTTTFAQSGIPTALAQGDVWVDTANQNKMYRAFNAGVNTIGAAAWVLINDPTAKTTTFAQSGIPTALAVGDIWVDTANQNKMYRAAAIGANLIAAGAWVLVNDLTTKTTTFAQGTIPTATAAGDIWVNTSDANKMYRAAAIGAATIAAGAWVLVQDPTTKSTTFAQGTIPTSVAAGDIWVNTADANKMYRAASAASTTIAAGKWELVTTTFYTKTFAQSGIPTSITAGDIWVDTANQNKMYRAAVAGATTIAAGAWVLVQDPSAKTTTFAQGTIPTALAIGDIWVNTSDANKMYRAASIGAATIAAGAWVLVQDLTTKTTTFRQSTVPTSLAVGDLWYDTGNQNRVYVATVIGATTVSPTGWVEVTDLRVNSWTFPGGTKIDGGQLQTNSVTANAVAARTIGADKLIVGGVTNVAPNGAGEWGVLGGIFPLPTTGISYDAVDKPAILNGVFKTIAGQGTTACDSGSYMTWDVETNQEYLVEIWAKADTANSRLTVEFLDQNNSNTTFSNTASTAVGDVYGGAGVYPLSAQVLPTAWTKYTAVTKVLAGATRMRVGNVYFNQSTGTNLTAIQSFAIRVRPRNMGRLIVDGAITANLIDADAINGKVVTGTTLRTAQTGARMQMRPGLSSIGYGNGVLEIFSGNTSEYRPAEIYTIADGPLPSDNISLYIQAPEKVGYTGDRPFIQMFAKDNGNSSSTVIAAQYPILRGTVSARVEGPGAGGTVNYIRVENGTQDFYVGSTRKFYIDSGGTYTYGDHNVTGNVIMSGGGVATGMDFTGFSSSGSFTSSGAYGGCPAGLAAGTFAAPRSGRIAVIVGGFIKGGPVTNRTAAAYELRTGATIGSGTVIQGYNGLNAIGSYGPDWIVGSRFSYVGGLTPGATYNIRVYFSTDATSAQVSSTSLNILPLF